MTDSIPLRCRCEAVRGVALGMSPATCTHIVCYCDDCRAFLRHLGREDLLDAHGGTGIVQITPARLRIEFGNDRIRCLRLGEKGMVRFHTACCNTPIGNTMGSAKVPFVGVPTAFFALDSEAHRRALGEPVGIHGKLALGTAPAGTHAKVPFAVLAKTAKMMLRGLVQGAYAPSSLYDVATGSPVSPPRVLTTTEREALRALG